MAATPGGGAPGSDDADRIARLETERILLFAAMDMAAEAIVVATPEATILYANPAALRATGYTLDELIGHNPRLFQSGLNKPEFYEAMWARLAGGEAWRGVLLNKRKSGELYEEDATIAPVFDRDGVLLAYVATKRDLTVERRLEADVSRRQSDRADIRDLMNLVRPAASIEGTATVFCQAVTQIEHIDGAMLLLLQPDGALAPISVAGVRVPGMEVGSRIRLDQRDALLSATNAGPWLLDLTDDSVAELVGAELLRAMRDAGITSTGYAGIRWEGELAGVLSIATRRPAGAEWLSSRLSVLEDVGLFAGALLREQVEQFNADEVLRTDLLDVIKHRRFRPVFQPVVELASGEVRGYEALTRFDGAPDPDARIAQAHAVGLGSRLEAACAALAVQAAGALPPEVWLAINFSAAAIIDGHAASVASAAERRIVIEITEHARIESYAAVRRAIRSAGRALLSVDDAGAGFASLKHILELQPDIVKLDIGLVRDIDSDPARQALVAGMCHFAAQTGTVLIAEGVETPAEAAMVRGLGVELAQGFLYGRPAPLPEPGPVRS